jgi:hypothetical protein
VNGVTAWGVAIGFTRDESGKPDLAPILSHVRSAIIDAGFVSRGRITGGLKEAYRPFAIDDGVMKETTDEALRLLRLSGDVDEFRTAAGRGYAATPPRRVAWGGDEVALLGAVTSGPADGIVRRVSAAGRDDAIATVTLADELGRPDWRSALVELGAADAPCETAAEFFAVARTFAASGDRYSLEEPHAVAVVSGRGDFFGRADDVTSGRWKRVAADGCFPGAIRSGYTTRNVVLNISGGEATLWQPPNRDLWRWIVVGATLGGGDPVLRYDPGSATLDFLTPPPRQAERAALLAGTQIGPWSWTIDRNAYSVLTDLMGSPRAAPPKRSSAW